MGLTSGQWCSPVDARESSYGNGSTVGCLVCLDDGSAFQTWDGVMVTAAVTFNVNGRVVTPPVGSTLLSPTHHQQQQPQHHHQIQNQYQHQQHHHQQQHHHHNQ